MRGGGSESRMNAAVIMQTCPSEETLAAFLDGRLDEKARLEVIEHLADCGDCRDLVLAADEYRMTQVKSVDAPAAVAEIPVAQPAATAEVVRPRFGARVLAPLASAAAIVMVLFSVPSIREGIFGTSGMAELVAAANAQPERTAKARLSGNFAYKEHRNPRGGGEPTEVLSPDLADSKALEAAAKAAERANNAPTAENLHALGVADILLKQRNDAVLVLERAAKASPRSADILNDLAAAYIARGAEGDYQRAHDAAMKAWAIKQTPAAAWNIAVSLQYAHKDAQAIAAWQKYLELDPNSEWSAEAKRSLDDLQIR
jgi:hypothetical protein